VTNILNREYFPLQTIPILAGAQAQKKLGEALATQCKEEGRAMGFEKAAEYAINFNWE